MGLDVPNLDDVTFAQLVEEAKKRIPQYKTEWTDFNLHDPGITLIELFAWLAEAEVFFLDKVTVEHQEKFLKLLNLPPEAHEKIVDAMLRVQSDLLKPYKAVTLNDFETLVTRDIPEVLRVKAIWVPDGAGETTGKVEVIVIAKTTSLDVKDIELEKQQVKLKVCNYLDLRRLLTTRISIVDPEFVTVSVQALIKPKSIASANVVKDAVTKKLNEYLDPLKGYGGLGWPFGKTVYKSEICELLERVDGVDCVQNLSLSVMFGNYSYDANGNVKIGRNALVYFGTHQIDIAGSLQTCSKMVNEQ